jgi:dolichol-phosphate mannosyltransferase
VRCVMVVPTYNEAENIKPFLAAARGAVPDADILVVDDNSPDGTGTLADDAAAQLGQVMVLHRPGKQGLGSAYRHGFQVALDAGYDVVVSMDVDFSHDPSVVPSMVTAIGQGADAVIGSRYTTGGSTVNWPWHRRMLSRWGNRYTGALLGIGVRDCTSGFRAYRADALRDATATSTAEGYVFLTELVRNLSIAGCNVVEVPITFRDREVGVSKMSPKIVAESMLRVTLWGVSDRIGALRRGR